VKHCRKGAGRGRGEDQLLAKGEGETLEPAGELEETDENK